MRKTRAEQLLGWSVWFKSRSELQIANTLQSGESVLFLKSNMPSPSPWSAKNVAKMVIAIPSEGFLVEFKVFVLNVNVVKLWNSFV